MPYAAAPVDFGGCALSVSSSLEFTWLCPSEASCSSSFNVKCVMNFTEAYLAVHTGVDMSEVSAGWVLDSESAQLL